MEESQGRVARNPGMQERKDGKNEGWKHGCKEGRKEGRKEECQQGSKDSTNQRKD